MEIRRAIPYIALIEFVGAFLLPDPDGNGRQSPPPDSWPIYTTPAAPPPAAGVVFFRTWISGADHARRAFFAYSCRADC